MIGWHRAGSDFIGAGDHGNVVADRESAQSSVLSSGPWPWKTQAGCAPRIHGETLKLGFEISERTVARYLRRLRLRDNPGKRWLTFLANHREVVAMDFFAVPTLTFKLLYCFSVIEHGRRGILHSM